MTDTEATASEPATKVKKEKTPEQKAQSHATRVVARALSKLEEGTSEEQKTRWSEGKTKYTSDARKLVRALGKSGVAMQLDETKTAKAKRAAGGRTGGKKGKKAGDDTATEA